MYKRLKIKIDNYFKNYLPYIVELGIFEGPKLAKALFPKNSNKDFLKIDIEGVEKQLFEKGNFNWLKKVHVLIIELHDRFSPGCAISFYSTIQTLNFSQFSNGENLVYINDDF